MKLAIVSKIIVSKCGVNVFWKFREHIYNYSFSKVMASNGQKFAKKRASPPDKMIIHNNLPVYGQVQERFGLLLQGNFALIWRLCSLIRHSHFPWGCAKFVGPIPWREVEWDFQLEKMEARYSNSSLTIDATNVVTFLLVNHKNRAPGKLKVHNWMRNNYINIRTF